MASPAVIMGAIFNVSLDLIGLYKIELLKLSRFLPKNLRIFEKNSRIVENFFVKKLLTWQIIRSFVTPGKIY